MSIIELVDAMEEHQKNGGSPFDCSSHKYPELKKEIQRATNDIFMAEMKKWSLPK